MVGLYLNSWNRNFNMKNREVESLLKKKDTDKKTEDTARKLAGKLDKFRTGEAVEIEKGVAGRLNKKNKTLELSTGEVIPVGENSDFFPKNEKEKSLSKHREKERIEIKSHPLGEFGYAFGKKGIAGSAGDIVDFFALGDEYLNKKQAEREVLGQVKKESPWTHGAATVASFLPEVAATATLPAVAAAPLLTAATSGSRLFTEPGNVAKEAGVSALAGRLMDVGGRWIQQAATRRGVSRSLPARQEMVRNQNIQGEIANNLQNQAQNSQFTAARQQIQSPNVQAIEQYLPAGANVENHNFHVWDWYNNNLIATRPEGEQVRQVIWSLFPGRQTTNPTQLAQKFRSLDNAIQNGTPEVQRALSEFENYLVDVIPTIQHPTITQTPANPLRSNLAAQPPVPTPNTFTPQPEPTLPTPQGSAEHAGDFLERNLFGGNTLTNNPLTKLAGLKYLAGKAALPIEAAYVGAKSLTSPTIGGQVARMGFRQGGIQAIEALAQKYPSYNNGVLENPLERRSLTKEIENDQEIPIEQKAIMQSKINRGQPLSSNLR